MSEEASDSAEVPKVTSEAVKDPARVEAGRELGKNSNKFKEAKREKQWKAWDVLSLFGVGAFCLAAYNWYTREPSRIVNVHPVPEPVPLVTPVVTMPEPKPEVVTPKTPKVMCFDKLS